MLAPNHPLRLAAACLVSVALVAGCQKRAPSRPAQPGWLALVPVETRTAFDPKVAASQARAREHQGDAAAWVALARDFVGLARTAQDPGYYAQANDAVDRALALDGNDLPALRLRGLLLLSDHRFAEAERLAKSVLAREPEARREWIDHALLGDAQVEQGDYEGALASYQRMIDLRQSQETYSRVAWLRWLTGDREGAEEIFKLAVDDGSADDAEGWAWCTSELGRIYWNEGRPKEALSQFELALSRLSEHAPSLLGKGRALAALGRLDEAVAALREAAKRNPSVEIEWTLLEALSQRGLADEARAVRATLERVGERTDPRTFALYLASDETQPADPTRAARAIRLAESEKKRRDDVFTEDVLAFALYRAGRLDEAAAASEKALALGTPDARMHFHAGAIKRAQGKGGEADEALRTALDENPYWDAREAATARAWLSSPLAARAAK